MKRFLFLRMSFLWIAAVILSGTAAWAQGQRAAVQGENNWRETLSQIEKIMEKYKPANPGCQLSISRDGKIVFSKVYGMADLERNVPLTTESLIEAGSVAKQFTAAAILLLEQQGKLSTQDDVRKYLPELPDYGAVITLSQMMRHTSGIRDWGSIAAMSGWRRSTKTYDNNDALNIVARQSALNFKPNERYLYSNSNYNLMAIVVERVGGMSLAEFSEKYIFEPAGMTHTEWRSDYKKIVKNRAVAYGKNDDAYQTEMPNEYVYGNGGLLTTTEDLLKWNAFYLSGKLGGSSLLDKQLLTIPFTGGKMNTYAAGLSLDTIRGWKAVSHSGATAGYRANLEYFPDLNLSIAWLSNTSEFDRGTPAPIAVRNILVPNKAATPNEVKPITLSSEKLKSFEGWYKEDGWSGGIAVKFTVRDGKLTSSRGGNMQPVSEDTFILGPNKIQFTAPGKKMVFTSPSETLYFSAVESAALNDKTLSAYSGVYHSDETESKLTFKSKDGKLFVLLKPQQELPLNPLYKNRFESPVGEIQFIRGKRNEFAELEVSDGRAMRVKFKKVEKTP